LKTCSRKNLIETRTQESLIHAFADEDNLAELLLPFCPWTRIVLITDIHHCVEDVLVWMALYCKDCLDAEDGPSLWRQLPQHLHPSTELVWKDFALSYFREQVHTGIMPVVFLPASMAMASTMTNTMATTMPSTMATAVALIMAAMAVAFWAGRIMPIAF